MTRIRAAGPGCRRGSTGRSRPEGATDGGGWAEWGARPAGGARAGGARGGAEAGAEGGGEAGGEAGADAGGDGEAGVDAGAGALAELRDRFADRLRFGTAGLRGVV